MDPLQPAASDPSMPDDGSAKFPDGAKIAAGADLPIEQLLDYKTGKEHKNVLARVKARLDLSFRNKQPRYDAYDRADEKRRLYVNLASPARRGDGTVDVTKKEMPFERPIVMPTTYAIHETRKAQISKQFFARAPFFPLDGVGLEDEKAAKMMEVKLEYDFQASDGPLAIYQLISDADAYGIGVLYDTWDEEYGWKFQQPDPLVVQISQSLGMAPPQPRKVWGPIRQFTNVQVTDPYMTWPDPRVTAANLQKGDFYGHRTYRSYYWLNERSQENGGPYFNLQYLKDQVGGGNSQGDSRIAQRNRTSNTQQFALKDSPDEKDKGYYILDHFQVKIIPSEWKLGPGTQPEIWWLTMADERMIVRAHPSKYEHGMFTYSAAETGFDMHQYANPGVVEYLDGLQRTIDWHANSRIENVRKFMNDMFAFSPELMEEDDIINPGPARWVRTTKEGTIALMQGMSFDQMFKQLNVTDVTQAHFEIMQALQQEAERLGASSSIQQGQQLEESRTLGEIDRLLAGGDDRVTMTAKILDAMGLKPLAKRMVANAQQFYDMQQWVRVVGDEYAQLDPEGLGRIQVNAQDLYGNFDYRVMTNLTAQDPSRMMQVWNTLYGMAIQNPALSQQDPLDPQVLNLKKLFKFVARLGGAREIDTFFANLPQIAQQGAPGVVPDEQIDQGVQSGNLVPMTQAPGLPAAA